MEIEKGTPVLWYDTIGQIPIRIGIPIVLTAPEVKAALEEFVGFVAELAAVPDADKMTFGEEVLQPGLHSLSCRSRPDSQRDDESAESDSP